jgi:hypothetical protein
MSDEQMMMTVLPKVDSEPTESRTMDSEPTESIKRRRGRKPKHTLDMFKEKLGSIQEVSEDPETKNQDTQNNDTKNQDTKNQDTKNQDTKNQDTKNKENGNIAKIHLQTLHFHFSEELVERFTYFATLHRFDERKVYKENWTKWIAEEDVAQSITTEIERLTAEGYKGDIVDKMFKSVRYYYRKKPFEPLPPKTRKTYESFPKEVLDSIDEHILSKIKEHATTQGTKPALISPAKSFVEYKTIHQTEITDALEAKYKKTYKNRFFLFTKQIREIKDIQFTESISTKCDRT